MKAAYEAARDGKAPPTDSGESPPMDFNAARSEFGRILGVGTPGSLSFDVAHREFSDWYDDASTDPRFDDVVRKAEAMFGTEEVLRIAHGLAQKHARSKR